MLPLMDWIFLAWKRSVVIALHARMKLGFIDGSYTMPDRSADNYDTWIRVDWMVTSWILNATTKKISKAFLYTKTSRQLWLDLEERYGENNGPMVYQLQRAITSITQGTLSVVDYFNNLSALCDEMECLKPTKACTCGLCTCGFTRIIVEEDNLIKLVKFLMGLDDSYDNIRNQILVMDPFPSINKAYSMVLRVERQRLINMQTSDTSEGIALHTKWNDRGGAGLRGNSYTMDNTTFKGKGFIDKRTQTCLHCGRPGHTKETCFKLHGVPDWYRNLKDQKRREGGMPRGFNVTTGDNSKSGEQVTDYGETMKQVTELLKLMKGQLPTAAAQDPLQINFAQGDDFAGISHGSSVNGFSSWIVDTGATNHMCVDSSLITQQYALSHSSSVHLPDGSTQPVSITDIQVPTYSDLSPPIAPTLSPTNPAPTIPLPTLPAPTLRRSQRIITQPQWVQDFVDTIQEPKSFLEANQHEHWRKAMDTELDALEKNHTWTLTSLPAEGVDYFDSFSPVTKTVTVRIFFAVASAFNWLLLQLDVNNAFLHGHLDEDVYMSPPEGYHKAQHGLVCILQRSLYGLKQSSRQWNIEFTSKLESYGFKKSSHDHCLFTLKNDSVFMALLVYVDDVLLIGNSIDAMTAVKRYLDDLFTIKDLGYAKYFLGLELARSSHGTTVSQRKYLLDIIHVCHLTNAKPTTTPLPAGIKFDASSGPLLASPDRYRCLVGRLLYLGFSRPDICFAVQQLSQFIQHPREPHWDAALHLVRYLKDTSTLGLFFPSGSSLRLSAFSDSDWASCIDTRRSVTGFCIFLGGSLISWKTKNKLRFPAPIPFHCNNKAAIHITENPVFHERTKHLDIDCHLVRDHFKRGFIPPRHIPSQHQVADLFTKALPAALFTQLISKLGMLSHAPT
ncbi:UNVERIFIED_CONTAM: Retrovirus-related Pol polyprotein from transposon RE1 [Sesamum latifolium]|uniref:Retrovirus-related Pol polyprotein from transposon RE1 n=1 Tax=Sesamum latifolium TaxID=2727402 RepID=A0AAW2XXI6_9LAMI